MTWRSRRAQLLLATVAVLVLVVAVLVATTDDDADETAVDTVDLTTTATPTTTAEAPSTTATEVPGTPPPTEPPAPATTVAEAPEPPSTGPGAWRPLAPSPLSGRSSPVSVWTGSELLVWAGIPETSDACAPSEGGGSLCGAPAVFDGAAYDPASDSWRRMADGPVPAGGAPTQNIPQGAWTGSELVVWGGTGQPIAAAYDPATDRWRDLPPGPLEAREMQTVVAWGDRVAVFGGRAPDFGPPRLDGAVLDPRTGEWSPLPDLPPGSRTEPGLMTAIVHAGRLYAVARSGGDAYALVPGDSRWRALGAVGSDTDPNPLGVAAGRWLFVTSGCETMFLDLNAGTWEDAASPRSCPTMFFGTGVGSRVVGIAARAEQDEAPPSAVSWDSATGTWTDLATPPLSHRFSPALAWTGGELLVWGGGASGGFGGPGLADGAALRP